MAFEVKRRVEFRDTDAAGIVHFSAFFPIMEVAEHELLRSVGISVLSHKVDDGPPISWPRVSAKCDYLAPARFEDQLLITVSVSKIGKTSVRYRFEINNESGPVATGEVTAVCCRFTEQGLQKVEIPASIRKLLVQFQ